jgi:hypothetical protein
MTLGGFFFRDQHFVRRMAAVGGTALLAGLWLRAV